MLGQAMFGAAPPHDFMGGGTPVCASVPGSIPGSELGSGRGNRGRGRGRGRGRPPKERYVTIDPLSGLSTPMSDMKLPRFAADGTPLMSAPGSISTPGASPQLFSGNNAYIAASAASAAANAAVRTFQLSNSPAFNPLGKSLAEAWYPHAPSADQIVAVRVDIEGASLDPPSTRDFSDEFLWNVHETQLTPLAFAKLTCEEENLPSQFVVEIEEAIKMAVSFAEEAPRPEPNPVELEVSASVRGVELRDRLIWNPAEPFAPESYARQLCRDLNLPGDMEAAVTIAVREELQRLAANAAGAPPPAKAEVNAVRSEKDALKWSPYIVGA